MHVTDEHWSYSYQVWRKHEQLVNFGLTQWKSMAKSSPASDLEKTCVTSYSSSEDQEPFAHALNLLKAFLLVLQVNDDRNTAHA